MLSLFIDVKSIQVISGFNLKRMKKSPEGAEVQKYQKNPKTIIFPIKNLEDQSEDHW